MSRLVWVLALAACSSAVEPVSHMEVRLSHEIVLSGPNYGQAECYYFLHMEGVGDAGRWVIGDHAQVRLYVGGELRADWEAMGTDYFSAPRVHAGESRRSFRWVIAIPYGEPMEIVYRWWFLADDGTGLTATHTVDC